MQSKHLTVRRPLLRSKHNVDYDAGGRGGGTGHGFIVMYSSLYRKPDRILSVLFLLSRFGSRRAPYLLVFQSLWTY